MNNGMELYISGRGLYLARNFTGNPCDINGGNAQFKPYRRRAALGVKACSIAFGIVSG